MVFSSFWWKKITSSTKVTIAKDHFLYARWKPKKPSTVKITVKAVSGNGVRIYWKEAKAVEGYTIYRATSKNGTYKRIKDVYKGSESWTDEDAEYAYDFDTDKVSFKDVSLKAGKTYYYKVAAFRNNNGKKKYGDKSKAVSIKL